MRSGKFTAEFHVALLVLGLALTGCGDNGGGRERSPAASETEGSKTAQVSEAGDSVDRDEAGDGSDCSVTMGWDPWEPYQFEDENGRVRGLDVELVRRIAEKANCEVALHKGNWEALLNRLRHGELDLLTGASRTERREQFARFTEPYRDETFVLYVREDDVDSYKADTLSGLLDQGVHVGVTSSYYYGEKVAALRETPQYSDQFVAAPVSELNYSRLLDYDIDGFLEDPFVAAEILRGKGLGDQITEYPIEINTGPVHLMFSRESVEPETVDRFDKALSELKTTGEYEKIIKKYRE